MPKTYACPFFLWAQGRTLRCERCRLDFPDNASKVDHVQRYCADLEGWRTCSIAKTLLTFYERTDKP